MTSDVAIITAIITAIFAGLAVLAKVFLTHQKANQNSTHQRAPTLANQNASGSSADRSGAFAAGLDYDDLPNTSGASLALTQTLGAINQTLGEINARDVATKDDVQRFSDTMSKRIDQVEAKADANTKGLSYVRGRIDK